MEEQNVNESSSKPSRQAARAEERKIQKVIDAIRRDPKSALILQVVEQLLQNQKAMADRLQALEAALTKREEV